MKVTIYELLGMIKDGKTPKKIKYDDMIWEYDGDYYSSKNNIILEEYCNLTTSLKDEIKIIEPQEHKIPEKLEIEQDTPNSNFYIRNEYGTKCALTKHSKIIADKINEILDYLEVNND